MFLTTMILHPTPSVNTSEEFFTRMRPLLNVGYDEYIDELRNSGKLIYQAFNFDASNKTMEMVSLWSSKEEHAEYTAQIAEMLVRIKDDGTEIVSEAQEEV